MSKLYKKGKICLGWFHDKYCSNIQSDEAENGLCSECEKIRREHITQQLKMLAGGTMPTKANEINLPKDQFIRLMLEAMLANIDRINLCVKNGVKSPDEGSEAIQREKEKYIEFLTDKFYIIPKTDSPEKYIEMPCDWCPTNINRNLKWKEDK